VEIKLLKNIMRIIDRYIGKLLNNELLSEVKYYELKKNRNGS